MTTEQHNWRILLIDDMPSIHEDFRKILGHAPQNSDLDEMEAALFGIESKPRHIQFELESAYQGQEALEKVKQSILNQKPYALAFLDMRMPPGWDGVETMQHLWSVDPNLQIVICTAYTDYAWDDILNKFDVGDKLLILKKPFDQIEVFQLANTLTAKWELAQQAKVQMETLEDMVQERVLELQKTNELLQQEVISRKKALDFLNETQHLLLLAERKQAEAEREARLAAEEANKAKSEFVANMSHEIRTPLNAVLGFGELLSNTELNSQQKEYVDTICVASDNLLVIINDILDLSKIESGKMDLERIPFNVHDMVYSVIKITEKNIKNKNISLNINIEEDIPSWIEGDPLRLRQILLNFINNATKFTEQGVITVHIHIIKTYEDFYLLRFEVSDTGIGLSPEILSKLFSPFTQADATTTRRFGGTGLGLSICKRLVELMKGHIGADSVEHQGSCFWFEVPLKRIHEYETLPALTQLSRVLDNSNAPIPPISVLLVEDNPVNQKVASIMLEKLNCKVHLANHGEEALFFTEKAAFNIIFMDCQMPVMDGLTATRNIRNDQLNLNQHTPIIALTANAFENDKKSCFESGMSDFISKPIHMNVLKDKLLQWHHQSHVDLNH